MVPPGLWDTHDGGNSTMPDMPGPRGKTFAGPWLEQQIILSAMVGFVSILIFGLWKRHYPKIYMARHHIQGSALPYQQIRNSVFGWILPTLLYSDHSALHTVGLDGAVALLFLKMGFVYLVLSSLWAVFVLIPVHYYTNGWIDGVKPGETFGEAEPVTLAMESLAKPRDPLPFIPLPNIVTRDTLYENTQLVSTFFYSLLAMWVLSRTYAVFISFRQGHAGVQPNTRTARTVEIRQLPDHLVSEDELWGYFSDIRLDVENISILKKTRVLDKLLSKRSHALFRLEKAWNTWITDPTEAQNYDPEQIREQTKHMMRPPAPGAAPFVAAAVQSNRPRPTMVRPWWNLLGPRVDLIDQLSYEFNTLDEAVSRMRASSFEHGHTAFVTFKNAWSAQIASQVVHYPMPGYFYTEPAVEPRDIIWVNEETSVWDRRLRQWIMSCMIGVLLIFTLSIDFVLATLVNLNEIKQYMPWLGDILDENLRVRAFVQNSLPTLLLILINALVPIAMKYSTYFQRVRSFSQMEHSVLSKYYLYLLFSVVFVFLFTSARDMLKELSQSPMHMIDKLAQSLPVARKFSLSYVVFQGLAIQPFQLVLLPSHLQHILGRIFGLTTPRYLAHMFEAPSLNISTLYPQALLIFTLAVLYSIVSPLISIFGALYFGVAYTVLKYQLLNVFDKPYDSHGHAWPLAIQRCLWALILFQVFQLSLFSVRKQVFNSLLIVLLIGYTIWFMVYMQKTFLPLTSYVNLYDIYSAEDEDVQRESHHAVVAQDEAQPIPTSGFYGDEAYEPPMSNQSGLLKSERDDTYGQPALTGRLPTLWLPMRRQGFLPARSIDEV